MTSSGAPPAGSPERRRQVRDQSDRAWVWVQRLLWLSLPATLGPLLTDAIDGRRSATRGTTAVLAWAAWAIGLVACLVPHTVTLTVVRYLHPAALAVAVVATLAHGLGSGAVLALAVGAATAIVALSPAVGDHYVNATSYGDERRLPLRPPGPLLLGPLLLAWAVPVAVALAGPLLLADGRWLVGLAVLIPGLALTALAVRAAHQLTDRWVVFVPAGLVLHDHLALADPVLFRRGDIGRLGPALAGTDALDLTQASLGSALELVLARPVAATPRAPGRRAARTVVGSAETAEPIQALLFAPSRPGRVLLEAAHRRLPVG